MEAYLTSPWIPAEWVQAHGIQPRGIWSAPDFQRGACPLCEGVCPFAEAVVRFAETRKDAAVIFSTACDQTRRGFDATILRGQRRAFLFNLPSTWQGAAAGQMFRLELERLGRFLVSIGGLAPTAERLWQAMLESGTARARLLESAGVSSARGFAEAVAEYYWDGIFLPPQPAAPTSHIPLALLGGPFLAPHWRWLDELEAAGGRVVLNATETSERSLSPAFVFDGGAKDPAEALAQGYCGNMVDVFQRPNTRLYSWLKPRLASRRARGIVLWHYTGCDLWRSEGQTLRETFGLPVLHLEASAEPGIAPREINRVQAFVETLR